MEIKQFPCNITYRKLHYRRIMINFFEKECTFIAEDFSSQTKDFIKLTLRLSSNSVNKIEAILNLDSGRVSQFAKTSL